jgi:hypothetical protein
MAQESPIYRTPPAGEVEDPRVSRAPRRWALLLLLIPFVALLYPPWYDNLDPKLGGVPFFVWYQFLWVILGSAITYVVYRLTDPRRRKGRHDERTAWEGP